MKLVMQVCDYSTFLDFGQKILKERPSKCETHRLVRAAYLVSEDLGFSKTLEPASGATVTAQVTQQSPSRPPRGRVARARPASAPVTG